METWKFWFMAGSGVYLMFFGVLMIKSKQVSMSRFIGVYNILVGIFSLGGAILSKVKPNLSNTIFFIFTIVLIISFMIFTILKSVGNKR